MTGGPARLSARDGRSVPVEVRFEPADRRRQTARALAVGLGGSAVGLATVVVPILHLFTCWMLPLFSVAIAWSIAGQKGRILPFDASCPACDGRVAYPGGAWEEPVWVRCAACHAPLRVEPGERTADGRVTSADRFRERT